MKSNYSADGHQMRTKPTLTTTQSKSSKLPAASKNQQNTLHNTPSTSFGACRRSWESSGGAVATTAASAHPQAAPLFYEAFTVSFWSDLVTVVVWEWFLYMKK
jgi:hypothetical protein